MVVNEEDLFEDGGTRHFPLRWYGLADAGSACRTVAVQLARLEEGGHGVRGIGSGLSIRTQ